MEINQYINRVTQIIHANKIRKERIKAMRLQGFNVVECGYMRNASKLGSVEFFPKKQEYRIAIARPSNHFYRQFDYVLIKINDLS